VSVLTRLPTFSLTSARWPYLMQHGRRFEGGGAGQVRTRPRRVSCVAAASRQRPQHSLPAPLLPRASLVVEVGKHNLWHALLLDHVRPTQLAQQRLA
jgi:hypothetical protein